MKILLYFSKILRTLAKNMDGKKIGILFIFKYWMNIFYLIKKLKYFSFVRILIKGFAILNLLLSIFIFIAFSDIDLSQLNAPTLTQAFSIIIGLFPIIFTDGFFYLYYLLKENIRKTMFSILENIALVEHDSLIKDKLWDEFEIESIIKENENIENKSIISNEDAVENKSSNKTKYSIIIGTLIILGIGISYYYHPEYYTLMYDYIANYFSNRKGGDGPGNKPGFNPVNKPTETEAFKGIELHQRGIDHASSEIDKLKNITLDLDKTPKAPNIDLDKTPKVPNIDLPRYKDPFEEILPGNKTTDYFENPFE